MRPYLTSIFFSMQQTSLNLIAISIFAMTLACLLGPVLHISPIIPAAATFAIMGLVTIDTLSWQNKGVTLFLDALSPRQYRERIARHEAGHFLVAYLLGIPITGYTLTAWEAFKQGQPGLGGVMFDTEVLKTSPAREMSLIVERFCTVFMAGIAAETLVYGSAEGGWEDRQKVRETLSLAGVSESIYQQKESWAKLQATNLIEQNWDAYEALVKAMQERSSIERCYQSIETLAKQS
jgi:hypothetical protein